MLSLKTVYFFQASIGILANAILLVFHFLTIYQVYRPRPTDIITCHLASVHIVMLLTALGLLSENVFKSLNFENELKCKLLTYVSRVMRGLSISTTCLLSIVQVITVCPSSFCLSRFKHKLTNYTIIALICIWSVNLSSNSSMISYTVTHSNKSNLLNVSKYCSLSSMNSIIRKIFFMLVLSQRVLFVGLMLLSSMYLVTFLCSHQRKSEYLHSMSISSRISPAKRATCTVLVLVSFFVIMYCVNMTISSFSIMLWKYEPVVLDIQILLGNVYSAFSPLLHFSSDKRILGLLKKIIDMTMIVTVNVASLKM
ncbi:putative vomeronasal receptor-like protein 4 [Ochotona princeps]|uniref:putative vomeronasal receptor-like protein 4 n=1 Tax=Ochotona princeps TaxID=9978 RepID=UPI0027146B44|nr:putative vomeronasal receptor-like protein 4 [Ochotona princeps]